MRISAKLTSLLLCLSVGPGCGFLDEASPPEAAVRSGIIGEWRLVEFIADPGDGSATWQRADGRLSETVQFRSDGRFSASTERMANQFRSYRVLDDERIEMVFTADVANRTAHTWYYRDVTNNTLTLDYGCIERCSGKYVRIR